MIHDSDISLKKVFARDSRMWISVSYKLLKAISTILESAASGHCLAPPEGPGTRGTPRVNLRGQPRGSGGDSKAI